MFKVRKPVLISVVGPTAVGKTALSLAISEKYSTEIVSADSRQMFKKLDIGTAKPTEADRKLVPHHLIDWLEPEEEIDVEKFKQEAEKVIHSLFEKHNIVVVSGGSTLYIQSLWFGLNEMPEIPPGVREKLNQAFSENGLLPLLEELKEVDPATYEVIDQQNHARVIRALEVYRGTGTAISVFRAKPIPMNDEWQHIKIALNDDRAALYARIDQRVDDMIAAGLETEIKELLEAGLPPESQSLRSIGYQEWVGYFEGKYDREEAIRLHKRNSRRYAKRQMTWYRRYDDVEWFEVWKTAEIIDWIEQQISETNPNITPTGEA